MIFKLYTTLCFLLIGINMALLFVWMIDDVQPVSTMPWLIFVGVTYAANVMMVAWAAERP